MDITQLLLRLFLFLKKRKTKAKFVYVLIGCICMKNIKLDKSGEKN